MLEWYRPGFDHFRLMDEVAKLIILLLGERPIRQLCYQSAFEEIISVDPHHASRQALAILAQQHTGYVAGDHDSRNDLLDLLMSQVVEPHLGRGELTFIYDYPASQCALAKIIHNAHGVAVAQRFELYVEGVELANGYFELTDADEQQHRFEADLAARASKGLPAVPPDRRLVAALRHGLPDCAGVALGLDRLLMLMANADSIRDVMAFPTDIA